MNFDRLHKINEALFNKQHNSLLLFIVVIFVVIAFFISILGLKPSKTQENIATQIDETPKVLGTEEVEFKCPEEYSDPADYLSSIGKFILQMQEFYPEMTVDELFYARGEYLRQRGCESVDDFNNSYEEDILEEDYVPEPIQT